MKPFEDLTDDEVLALSVEDVGRYCDLACAEHGIPLLPPEPGVKPRSSALEPDVATFVVPETEYRSREAAEAVAAEAMKHARVAWNYAEGKWTHRVLVGDTIEEVTVSRRSLFSPLHYNAMRESIDSTEKALRVWETQKQRFDKILRDRDNATAGIRERIEEAAQTRDEREDALREWKRYLSLADGDERLARRFFLKVRPGDERHLPPAPTTPCEPAPRAEPEPEPS